MAKSHSTELNPVTPASMHVTLSTDTLILSFLDGQSLTQMAAVSKKWKSLTDKTQPLEDLCYRGKDHNVAAEKAELAQFVQYYEKKQELKQLSHTYLTPVEREEAKKQLMLFNNSSPPPSKQELMKLYSEINASRGLAYKRDMEKQLKGTEDGGLAMISVFSGWFITCCGVGVVEERFRSRSDETLLRDLMLIYTFMAAVSMGIYKFGINKLPQAAFFYGKAIDASGNALLGIKDSIVRKFKNQ